MSEFELHVHASVCGYYRMRLLPQNVLLQSSPRQHVASSTPYFWFQHCAPNRIPIKTQHNFEPTHACKKKKIERNIDKE
jgi:hypothetical protein